MAPFGHAIQLTWVQFDLESHGECVFDYVEVYENNTVTGKSQKIGKYCGQSKPPSVVSSFNAVTVFFVTDSSVHNTGFLLSYTFVEEKDSKSWTFSIPAIFKQIF